MTPAPNMARVRADAPANSDELAAYTFRLLRQDGVLAWYRGQHHSAPDSILMTTAASDASAAEAGAYLHNEFALRARMTPAWAIIPTESIWWRGAAALLYRDDAGAPLERRPPDISSFLALAVAMTAALRAAHEAGVVHRDVKPGNFVVDAAGRCRLTGFGIASAAAPGTAVHGATAPGAPAIPDAARVIRGTLAYMSPEHTGRTRFPPDARSDLYSLGVTLFELLTGRLPFEVAQAAQAGEWIHAHLASEPASPGKLAPGVPAMLSLLILKLLAKCPDQRYQGAAGLESDLKRCQSAWQAGAGIAPFPLAQRDRAATPAFSDVLYGRAAALGTLAGAFDQVRASGAPVLALVDGPSGVGKSALLNAFVALPQLRGASVAFAKVDQYGGAAPYAALAAALRRLVLCVLGQGEGEVRQWRQRVQLGLCADRDLAFRLVPELELLMGEPAQAGVSAGREVEGRLAKVVYSLLQVFATPERPLVLIVDDVQWLDAASMRLLEHLSAMRADLPFLLLLSLRTNEPDGIRTARLTLELLRQRALSCHEVTLELLDLPTLEAWLAATLSTGRRQVAALAALVHHKTAGNPYFVKQFIKLIVDESLMVRAAGSGKWRFDLGQIGALRYTDNVADVVLLRLARLPPRTRELLGAVACLARAGQGATLCGLYAVGTEELAGLMAPALAAEVLALESGGYLFTHDRLQEAAYASMPAGARRQLHLGAGKLLAELAEMADSGGDAILFGAVGHLARVTELLVAPDEQLRYAGVALLAARSARRACAYDAALRYLAMARTLLAALPAGVEAARLGFDVELETAGCEFFSGNLDAASSLVERLLASANDRLARGHVHRLAIEIDLRRCDNRAAVATGREALRQFGITLPAEPSDADCARAFDALRARLDGDWRARLRALPPLADPEIEVAMALLAELIVPASFTDTRLHFLQLCHSLQLTLDHGMSGEAAVALAWFGVMVCQRHSAYADGFEYGLMARALVAQHGYAAHEARVLLALDQLSVWTQPLAFSLDCAHAGFTAAVGNGDSTTACFSWVHRICMLFERGDHLDKVSLEIAGALAFVRHADFRDVEAILLVQQQFVDKLRLVPGADAAPSVALAESPDEPMSTLRFWRWMYFGITDYLDADLAGAEACLGRAGGLAWSAPGHIHQAAYRLFELLTLCATGLPRHRQRIDAHAAQIAEWAAINPGSFADTHALAQAAVRAMDGDLLAAQGFYEQAIALSLRHGFDHHCALAHEQAAALCRLLGHGTAEQAHLRGARDAYRRWGAGSKVARLESEVAALAGAPPARAATIAIVETAAIRDIDSVIRSARALSEEIQLEPLVQTLMQIALEHASAQRGLLIRLRGSLPVIEACALMTPDGLAVTLGQGPAGAGDLPATMLQTVMRTRQPVSVGDGARPAPFNADPYLLRYPRCAAICIPMLKQSQLVGVLYLENLLSPQAFTGEHAKVLVLLAAQAAVSLETARLYAELLEENQQRRSIEKALRESKATLLQAEQINQSGSFTWEVGRGVLTCSAEFCRIFGFDPAEPAIAFSAILERIHPDDRDRVVLEATSCVVRKYPMRIGYRVVCDGAVRYISSVGAPISREGEVGMYVGTAIDITERRAADDTLRTAQAELARVARVTTVGQLTASIAHEVSQPLMSISSNAGASLRWLERDPPELGQVRRGLQDIAAQSQRAGAIIQGLQALTRKSTPVIEPVDLHATIRHILSMSREELERHEVTLVLALDAGSGWVTGDAVQLQQVLLNIVINAIEAMNNVRGRARTLTICSQSDGAGRIGIRADDSGIGFDTAMAGRFFEAFYSTKDKGMGMGLAICRSIIEAHYGCIEAQARLPHGCSILFTLPETPAPVLD
jgi:PAS domain S-box-containing protein